MMGIHEYLQKRGATAQLARELGVTHAAVRQWMSSRVPAERVVEVERATGIDRELIRPDLYRRDPPSERAA
jgi:DNA-binding transcriptional regulator YdaS (Cro superfamily)